MKIKYFLSFILFLLLGFSVFFHQELTLFYQKIFNPSIFIPEKAIVEDPDNPFLNYQLAQKNYHKKNFVRACNFFDKASNGFKMNGQAPMNQGLALANLGNSFFKHAEQTLATDKDSDPREKKEKAIKLLESCLESYSKAFAFLGQDQRLQNNHALAAMLLDRLKSQEKDDDQKNQQDQPDSQNGQQNNDQSQNNQSKDNSSCDNKDQSSDNQQKSKPEKNSGEQDKKPSSNQNKQEQENQDQGSQEQNSQDDDERKSDQDSSDQSNLEKQAKKQQDKKDNNKQDSSDQQQKKESEQQSQEPKNKPQDDKTSKEQQGLNNSQNQKDGQEEQNAAMEKEAQDKASQFIEDEQDLDSIAEQQQAEQGSESDAEQAASINQKNLAILKQKALAEELDNFAKKEGLLKSSIVKNATSGAGMPLSKGW